MPDNIFAAVQHWKDFERLCADLLEAEGYKIQSEPSVDRTGVDLLVTKEYRSHDDECLYITWRVQCKHYAVSENPLGRKEVEGAVCSYQANRGFGEGLLLMVDTDYSEEAKSVIDNFLAQHPDARIDLWNQRQLRAKLDRHPHILARYGLNAHNTDYLSLFQDLKLRKHASVLLVSDQSALAHDITSILRSLTFEVTFLPFWNYQSPSRSLLLINSFPAKFDLVVVFLGDSFGLPMPHDLQEVIAMQHEVGASLLLFPFMAWSMRQGAYSLLDQIVPVRLVDPSRGEQISAQRVTGEFRRGDFRGLLASDSFAEDQYVELDPSDGIDPFARGIERRFGISHSFEYLSLAAGARNAWADTTGNPIVAVNAASRGRICYLNTCCHSCMTTVPMTSPIKASTQFAVMVRNIIGWLLG